MGRLFILLRYDWPLHFALLLTNWLPDNVICLRIRGFMTRPFIGECGKNFRLGRNITLYNPINLHIGENVYIALGCVFLAIDHIWVDDEAIFGPYCVLSAADHTRNNNSFRFGDIKPGPIRIKRGSWLGAHVVVTANSCVGEGALVAAGAVVSRDIPDDMLAGGVPAKVIKQLSNPE